jgi:hypothetical protein
LHLLQFEVERCCHAGANALISLPHLGLSGHWSASGPNGSVAFDPKRRFAAIN